MWELIKLTRVRRKNIKWLLQNWTPYRFCANRNVIYKEMLEKSRVLSLRQAQGTLLTWDFVYSLRRTHVNKYFEYRGLKKNIWKFFKIKNNIPRFLRNTMNKFQNYTGACDEKRTLKIINNINYKAFIDI